MISKFVNPSGFFPGIFTKVVLFIALGCFALASARSASSEELEQADISGVWWIESYTANLEPVEGGDIPFTPTGKAQYEQNQMPGIVDQARHLCWPPGASRIMTSAYPFRIVQTANDFVMVFEENRVNRQVKLDAEHEDPDFWDPSFMGETIGHWDGKALILHTTNFKDTFLDDSRLPHSDQLVISERLEMQPDGQMFTDTLTFNDPVMYTRPWTAKLVYRKVSGMDIEPNEWVCGEPHRDVSTVAGIAGAPANHPSREETRPPLFGETLTQSAEITLERARLNGYWIGELGFTEPTPLATWEARLQPWAFEIYSDFQDRYQDVTSPTPDNNCLPYIMPGNSPYLLTHRFVVTPDLVLITYLLDRQSRIIYMNADHPEVLEPTFGGHSVGHWDGNTLVVDTLGWNNRSGYVDGIPHSPNLRIEERYSISEDGSTHTESVTYYDPDSLQEPFTITNIRYRDEPFQEFVNAENNEEFQCPTAAEGSLYEPFF